MGLLRGLGALLLHTGNSLLWCLPLYVVLLLRVLVPGSGWRRRCDRLLAGMAGGWIGGTLWLSRHLNRIDWEVEPLPELPRDGRYLVVCNHQSWVDILALLHALPRTLPFPRFFAKRAMLWLPFLGIAFKALDFPIMHRYSREFLERHPHLRDRDLLVARASCERFRHRPVTIVNFLEGTRFTAAKHDRQNSPYRHLLKPRSGGAALVVNALGDDLRAILDLTIAYPEGVPTFWDFLCGRMRRVRVATRALTVPDPLREGDYLADPDYRRSFQDWVGTLWGAKDLRVGELLGERAGR